MTLQLMGHISMSVSSFMPENMTAWRIQFVAFTLGKMMTRVAVYYTYYSSFRRMATTQSQQDKPPQWQTKLFHPMFLCGVAFILDIISMVFQLSSPRSTPLPLVSSILLLISSVTLNGQLDAVVVSTKKDIPWHKINWMMGYYWTLRIIPAFLYVQDISAVVVVANGGWASEAVVLGTNLGMTKSILMLLSSQTYEMALSWSQERPKWFQKLENLYQEYKDVKNSQRTEPEVDTSAEAV